MIRKAVKWARWSTFCVEIIGLAASAYLVLISFKVLYPGDVPCPRSKLFHCTSVLRGEWSKIGPVPISVLGLLYFLIQAFLSAAAERDRLWIHRAKVLLGTGALVFVAALRAIEFVWLKGICPWCWAVALITLLELVLCYPLASPPLPRASWGRRIAYTLGAFVGCAVIAVVIGFMIYEREQQQARKELRTEKTSRPAVQPSPSSTPTKTVAQTPTPPLPSPSPTKPRNEPPRNEGEVEDGVPLTNDVKLLVRHGWTVAAATESVNRLIREDAPVLLLVFDPWCEECQAFIRGGLENDEIRKLPVKLVAIEQTSLTGKLSGEVQNVPTLMLIDRRENILFKHVGRMGTRELIDAIEKHLQP
ncbi:MAG: hypothetical protein N2Z21_03690 [Candidatus Sumerlaeaceae bacterium]|nr:hypothetical protein [Candidatus Sumerlaeaceae bacterium]